ncbi:hypothetical protein FEM48_Zijuj02G0099600 [Ziziphus jujuba var. spinosa]|uniref:DUF7895 domain-containing protein n=1 Tax=Ziziphus jujuba var. spinosa TaxID=714518 RepID=A0A978VV32_ZIZJJ|nr:hypothetical protein FEM48_Zijuj02G0099600 [Ziziphus jujuba var. spinosa]
MGMRYNYETNENALLMASKGKAIEIGTLESVLVESFLSDGILKDEENSNKKKVLGQCEFEVELAFNVFSGLDAGLTCNLKLKPSHVSCWDPGVDVMSEELGKRSVTITSALPEAAASVVIASTVVGAAATFLVRRSKAPKEPEVALKTCEDCGGSGICSECNGEGFVLKKRSDESSQRARTKAKNMATRFTAGGNRSSDALQFAKEYGLLEVEKITSELTVTQCTSIDK